MSKEHDDFVPWYRHDTAAWLRLSLAARGCVAEVARKLNRRGELKLGGGLEDLAFLLRVEWETLKPALDEVILSGRLVWDSERWMLVDPEYENRKRRGSAERMRDLRARKKAEAVTCDASDGGDVTQTDVTGVTPVLSDLSPLSSLRSDQSQQISEQPPGQPPDWFTSTCERVQGDTGERFGIAEAWIRYAGHRKNKSLPTNANDAAYWLGTVMVPEARRERERRRKFEPAPGAVEHQRTKAEVEADAKEISRRMRELAAKQRTGT